MKKFVSIIMTVLLMLAMTSIVFANSIDKINPVANEGFKNIGQTVLGYVEFIGIAIAIGMLIYLGIKYTMASANEKADLKKGSISYVIGAFVIGGAIPLFNLISNIGKEVVGD